MDLGEEGVLILQGGGPLRPCEDTKTAVKCVTQDRPLVRATPIPATACPQKAAPNVLETHGKLKKDVKFEGTNRRSPLESTKVSKNKLERSANKAENAVQISKRAKTNQKNDPKGAIFRTGIIPGLPKLAGHPSPQSGSATPTCGKPAAFRPTPAP